MIDSSPEVMCSAVDLQVNLVQVSLPVAMSSHRLDTLATDPGGENRAELVPPVPHLLVADLDAPFVQQILNIPQRQREANVEHHRQADNLGTGFEVPERGGLDHTCKRAPAQPCGNESSLEKTAGAIGKHLI